MKLIENECVFPVIYKDIHKQLISNDLYYHFDEGKFFGCLYFDESTAACDKDNVIPCSEYIFDIEDVIEDFLKCETASLNGVSGFMANDCDSMRKRDIVINKLKSMIKKIEDVKVIYDN